MPPPTKLLIEALRDVPKVDEMYCAITLSKLKSSILRIHSSLTPNVTYEELHRIVQDLTWCNQHVKLYKILGEVIKGYLDAKVEEFLRSEKRGVLEWMEDTWLNYKDHSRLIRNIYLWLDYAAVRDSLKTPSVWNSQLDLFRTVVVENEFVVGRLIEGLLGVIESERTGQVVDVHKLKLLTKMLTDLEVYARLFETNFLHRTDQMYQHEGPKVLRERNLVFYLHYVKTKMNEETKRVGVYLRKSTEEPLMNIVKHRLIGENMVEILKKVEDLFDRKLVDDVKLLYSLVGLVEGGRNQLRNAFEKYLNKRGEDIVHDLTNEKNMMQELILLKRVADKLVRLGFENDGEFVEMTRTCFKCILNLRPNKCPELLAKYVHKIFRKRDIVLKTGDVLHEVLVFFKFMAGKDIFSAFYKLHLARRLMTGNSTNLYLEKCMISTLKLECGANFTVELEGMLTDIDVSDDINRHFKKYLKESCDSGIKADVSIDVLTASFWPSFHNFTVTLPNEIFLLQDVFQKFYAGKYSGRKLRWQQGLGQCILRGNFDTGRRELEVSVSQACILLLFNSLEKLTYTEIKETCNLDDDELKRNLQVLSSRTSRILRKSSSNDGTEGADVFTFNADFTDKFFRVKINSLQMRQAAEKITITLKGVCRDRQCQIDAAIVRIMKRMKRLQHKTLMEHLYRELRLPLSLNEVKKRIEMLIEREYIERDSRDQTVYKYVA